MNTHFFSYIFLAMGMMFIWIRPLKSLWAIPFFIALGLGISTNHLGFVSVIFIGAFFLACYFSAYPRKLLAPRITSDLIVFILGIALIVFYLPLSKHWKIISNVTLSEFSVPYSFVMNFDKGSVGLVLLALLIPVCRYSHEWVRALRVGILSTFLAILILLILALVLGYVKWDLKIPFFYGSWLFHNAFFVAIPEETFFRGFVLRKLADYFRNFKTANVIALLISSLIFGLAHFRGGMIYIALSTVAGIIYGLSYLWSGKVEGAIFTHFLLNTVHFFAFTYPALK